MFRVIYITLQLSTTTSKTRNQGKGNELFDCHKTLLIKKKKLRNSDIDIIQMKVADQSINECSNNEMR